MGTIAGVHAESMRKTAISTGAIFALALAGACGDDSADRAPTTAAPSVPAAELTIEAGSGELPDVLAASVTSNGAVAVSGYLEEPAAVAAALADPAVVDRLVNGPATDVACTEQYGGPDVAHVTGTIGDDEVDTRFHRADGCGIADWELAQALLPEPIWSDEPEAAYGDDAHPVQLTVGERFTIRLESNITTGHEWQLTVPDELTLIEDEYEEPADSDVVGQGGAQRFVIEATAPGSATVELVYRQPFDPDANPADSRTFHVEIVAAG